MMGDLAQTKALCTLISSPSHTNVKSLYLSDAIRSANAVGFLSGAMVEKKG